MEYGLVDRTTSLEVLHHDALEEFRSHVGVPDAIRINHHDRPACANTKAGRLAALHPRRSEQQPFALEKARQLSVQIAAASIR